MPRFADTLATRIDEADSLLCVGLDPVLEQLPVAVRARHHEATPAIREFCMGVIDAVASACAVIKPQSACFERYGSRGVAVLEDVCAHARGRGLLVLLDAKRGDIGISAEHYAAAAVHCGAHAITVNGYLGPSTIEPYLGAGLGVFVLVRTSNPDSDAVQSRRLEGGSGGAPTTVALAMAELVRSLGEARRGASGWSDVGAVVGATKGADGPAMRGAMPDQFFLVPGYGAQGGTPNDIATMARAGARGQRPSSAGLIVNASRSVIYPKADQSGSDWKRAVANAAENAREELRAIVAAR
jgi:orotidine-5'-phosphate decarboxylase